MLKLSFKSLRAHLRRFILTGLSIALGVGFVAGSYVFTDSISSTFDGLFDGIYANTDLTITSDLETGSFSFDEQVLEQVRQDQAVAEAGGYVSQAVTVLDKQGKVITTSGAPIFGDSWSGESDLNPQSLASGRHPQADNEVLIDSSSAEKYEFAPGDTIQIQGKGKVQDFTLVGTTKFGEQGGMLGSVNISFTLKQAQKMLGLEGRLDQIAIKLNDGEDVEANKTRFIEKFAGQGLQVRTADEEQQLATEEITSSLNFVNIFFLAFSGISIFVGTFIIQNTFRIIISQQSRELALLRSIGATKRQIISSVLLEALMVGVIASLLGILFGVCVAWLIQIFMGAIGIDIPSETLSIKPRTVVVSLIVGMTVTAVSALLPALKAARVSPLEAMRDNPDSKPRKPLFKRTAFGVLLGTTGLILLFLGLKEGSSEPLYFTAAGCGAVFIGMSVLAPLLARPFASLMALIIRPIYRSTGKLAIGNVKRSPRRIATTASSLMIGVALVTFIGVLGSSVKSTIDTVIGDSFPADVSIVPSVLLQGGPSAGIGSGVSQDLVDELRESGDYSLVTPLRYGYSSDADPNDPVGANVSDLIIGIEPDKFNQGMKLKPQDENYAGLENPDTIYINAGRLEAAGLSVGDTLEIDFAKTGPTKLKIVGSFEDAFDSDYFLSLETFDTHILSPANGMVVVNYQDGESVEEARAKLDKRLEEYPNLVAQSAAELIETASSQIDQMLGLIWGLLGLAIVISVLGITNTLSLSVSERQHELGMLRAIGMTRKQTKRMINAESIVIALFGTTLGIVLGVFFGRVMMKALEDEGLTGFVVPFSQIAITFVVAIIVGLIASYLPARRAAKTDILKAIETE